MNAKKAKLLRKVAQAMSVGMVDKDLVRGPSGLTHHPRSTRSIYQNLKTEGMRHLRFVRQTPSAAPNIRRA